MDVAEQARLSYIQGWAETGGPLTDRVKAGCTAAMACAVEDPTLVEATLQIGRLEGTWALIFADREEVHDHHGPAITAAWRALIAATVDVPALARAYREAVHPGQTRRQRRTAAERVAPAAMAAVDSPWAPEYGAMITTLTAAIRGAERAGYDAGLLLAGPHEDAPPPDQGNSDHDQRVLALAALALIRKGTTRDLANDLAGLNPDDVDDPELADEIAAELDDDERASGLYADQTVGGSFLQGMLAAFARSGLTQVWWVTAGDSRVCDTCADLEDASPYLLILAPTEPHPRCRCILSTA